MVGKRLRGNVFLAGGEKKNNDDGFGLSECNVEVSQLGGQQEGRAEAACSQHIITAN